MYTVCMYIYYLLYFYVVHVSPALRACVATYL